MHETDAIDVTDASTWPEFLTSHQVALILQTAIPTVHAMIRDGRLDCVRYSQRLVRIPKASVISARGGQESPACPA